MPEVEKLERQQQQQGGGKKKVEKKEVPGFQGSAPQGEGSGGGGGGGSFLSFLEDLVRKDLGEGAGGGRGRGRGGGGGNALAQQLQQVLQQMKDQQGSLVNLDEQTLADLEAMRANEEATVRDAFNAERDNLLARLFGRGVNQSTIAGDVGGRLVEGLADSLLGVEAGAANRRLAVRSDLTQQSLQNLSTQGNLLLGQQAQNLGRAELAFRKQDSIRQLRASLLDSALGRKHAAGLAHLDARTRLEIAQMSADTSIRTAGIAAGASRYSASLRYKLGMANLEEGGRQFDERLALDDLLGNRGLDIREQDLELQRMMFRKQMKQQSRSQQLGGLSGLLGGAGGILGGLGALGLSFSDERLKEDIQTVNSSLDKLSQIRGVTWKWKDRPDGPTRGGVLAQEVEQVLPEAVYGDNDEIKVVDYGAIIALLIESNKQLAERVEQLERDNG